jgi:2-aminoadipate transaminase
VFIEEEKMRDWKLLFSDNIRDFEGYSIGKMLKYVNEPDIISFAAGMPSSDTFPRELMKEASNKILENNLENVFQYSAIPGENILIEAIIDFLKTDDIFVDKKNILITSSGQHGIDITGRLFLDPGDSIVIDRPTFSGAIVSFQMQRPNFIGVDIEEDGSNISGFRDKIEKMKNTNTPLPKFIYVVPDFQNPSGITMSLQKRESLLDLSYEYNIPIVEDSPYRVLRYYGDSIPSIFALDQKRDGENVIGVYTFSKIFVPGIRLGFNIGPDAVIEKMTNIKEANVLNTPKWNQDLCTYFLKNTDLDKYFKRNQNYYRKKLKTTMESLEENLKELKDVSWTEPEGGFFLWITVRENVDTMELFYEAVKEERLAFVPGEVFYGENPEKNHMRLNFSYPKVEEIKEGIKRLGNCLKRHL